MKAIDYYKGSTKFVAPGCFDLPVLITGDNEHVSVWKLTIKERFRVFFGGKIFLGILNMQPPCFIAIKDPVETIKGDPDETRIK